MSINMVLFTCCLCTWCNWVVLLMQV